MSSRNPEEQLVARLHALGRAAADEQPSPGIEAGLLEEFRRRQPALGAGSDRRAPFTASWRPRLSAGAWLALAASLVMIMGAAAGWRAWMEQPAGNGKPAVRAGGARTDLTAAAWRRELPAPAAVRTVGTAAVRNPPSGGGRRVGPQASGNAPVEFVAWPGAAALPALESGELVRMELPAAVVPLLGLSGEARTTRPTVSADVIVGQDGRPRAVRLVNDER